MKVLIIILFAVITAILAAMALALIKVGSEEILRYAEQKKNGFGVFLVLLSWVILLPIMILLSLFVGLYKYITVRSPTYQNHKPGSC